MELKLLNLYNRQFVVVSGDRVKEEVGSGWGGVIERLIADLQDLGWNGEIHQVKEKFGALRFYVGPANDAIYARIVRAENESMKVCERCGNPGAQRSGGWIKTLCDPCVDERTLERRADTLDYAQSHIERGGVWRDDSYEWGMSK